MSHITSRRTPIPAAVLERAALVIKTLAHPMRMRLLEALEAGEQSVSALQEYTGATQAAVSQQLAVLRAYGIVAGRRVGNHVYYHVSEPKVGHILECVRSCDFPEGAPRRDVAPEGG